MAILGTSTLHTMNLWHLFVQPLSLHVALSEDLSCLQSIKGVVAHLRLVFWLLKHQGTV